MESQSGCLPFLRSIRPYVLTCIHEGTTILDPYAPRVFRRENVADGTSRNIDIAQIDSPAVDLSALVFESHSRQDRARGWWTRKCSEKSDRILADLLLRGYIYDRSLARAEKSTRSKNKKNVPRNLGEPILHGLRKRALPILYTLQARDIATAGSRPEVLSAASRRHGKITLAENVNIRNERAALARARL